MGSERWIAPPSEKPNKERKKRKEHKGEKKEGKGEKKKEEKVKRREILTEIYKVL